MSIQRLSRSRIDWVKFARLVPEEQKQDFVDLKAKHDRYLAEVNKYPETPPAINWDHYKKTLSKVSLVEDFQKNHDALKIPYPKDTVMADIDKEIAKSTEQFKLMAKEIADGALDRNAKIEKWNQVPSHENVTWQEIEETFPKLTMNKKERPVDAMFSETRLGEVWQLWAKAKKIHDAAETRKKITAASKRIKDLEADFEK